MSSFQKIAKEIFNASELKKLQSLSTPIQIQDFLDTLSINFEYDGETNMSPRRVLRHKKAHCMEAALFAAATLWLHGHEPLIMNMKAYPYDDDHCVALYKINGFWGAISKTNHTTVRFRDPVYRTVRELAMSYFHEYFVNTTGDKVLQSYSRPINLKRFGTEWLTTEEELFDLAAVVDKSPHFPYLPSKNKRHLRRADRMERKSGKIIEWRDEGEKMPD
ncbi:MAG: hypothetical protein RL094_403 [Candidatus Parcubacteria bacterium]|jgi:hypothetical protein